jgi:dTDP-4-amino-4,6-dideoxygalactose transaminase
LAADRPPLATPGSPAEFPDGPPPWPLPDDSIRAALDEVYRSGDWGKYHGRQCRALAAELAALHQLPYVTLCCSGTLAIELALRGLGVEPGDEVLLAGYDFPGNFRAIEAVGARPVLVDVAPRNWNLDPALIAAACSPQTRAIVVSHLHGGAVPMQAVRDAARQFHLGVVEDACQCPGAIIEGRRAGTWGDAGVLSFGGSKLLTAGRGGAVLTADAAIQQRIKVFSERGNQAFPLSELQAAVLRPQLAQLAVRNATRLENARRLIARLQSHPALCPLTVDLPQTQPGYYKLGIMWQGEAAGGAPREDFLAAVQAQGVALDAGFRGFARRSDKRCRVASELRNAKVAAERMMVLHHPVLLQPPEIIDRVARAFQKALGGQPGS